MFEIEMYFWFECLYRDNQLKREWKKNLLQIDSILYKLRRMFVGIQGDSTFSIEEFDLTNKKTRFRTLKRKETFFDM